ncbi:hypothetical protein [Dyella sp.]|uniref:hypothetical protein n=1 Tax=Dyella sp. TaxID=1869338 RepID=UPI003F8038F3
MFRRSALMLGLLTGFATFGNWLQQPVIHLPNADGAPPSRRGGKGRGRTGARKPGQAPLRHGGTHTKAARQRRRSLRLRRG